MFLLDYKDLCCVALLFSLVTTVTFVFFKDIVNISCCLSKQYRRSLRFSCVKGKVRQPLLLKFAKMWHVSKTLKSLISFCVIG